MSDQEQTPQAEAPASAPAVETTATPAPAQEEAPAVETTPAPAPAPVQVEEETAAAPPNVPTQDEAPVVAESVDENTEAKPEERNVTVDAQTYLTVQISQFDDQIAEAEIKEAEAVLEIKRLKKAKSAAIVEFHYNEIQKRAAAESNAAKSE